tara:strand:+ start:2092 stop:2370 length:279 start_codon:yes stop_codon:yes gene_type:complete
MDGLNESKGCTITLTDKEAKALHSLREVIQQEIKNVVSNEHEVITESDVEDMITNHLDSELDQYITNWCDNYLEERIQNVFRDKLTLSVELV